jgi:hypothetical protein
MAGEKFDVCEGLPMATPMVMISSVDLISADLTTEESDGDGPFLDTGVGNRKVSSSVVISMGDPVAVSSLQFRRTGAAAFAVFGRGTLTSKAFVAICRDVRDGD